MEVILRKSIPSDINSLAELCTELGYPASLEEISLRMSHISKQENCKTIVAELGGKVVGFMGMTMNMSWENNGCFLRIQALVVTEKYRKLGVGKLLLDYAECYANEINAKSIALNCGNRSERENAHKFYLSVGFEAKSTGYKKDVL